MIVKTIIEGNLFVEQGCGTLFIVSGPSGVGKTTVVTELLQQHGHAYQLDRMVTYTTKKPRAKDIDGVDYHFITQSEFEDKVAQGFFLEWSGEYGACYGTPAHVVGELMCGKSYILVIDRLGASQILAKHPEAVLIWIEVSSMDLLSDRLNLRASESFEQIQTRLLLAKKEIDEELRSPMYHHVVLNNDLKHAVERLFELIMPRCISVQKDIL